MSKRSQKMKNLKRKLLELLDSSSEEEETMISRQPPQTRRRILSSDSEEENILPVEPPKTVISADLLRKMGHVSKEKNVQIINSDLTSIWSGVLKDGLPKEVKEEVINNIPLIKDCQTSAPTLNIEIKATLSAQAVKRDDHLCEKQNQIGHVICGLGEILSKSLSEENMETVEKLSNCIRLLCDVHHMESETRRAVILPGLDKALKTSLENTEIGSNLFGRNLLEVIRETRILEKTKQSFTKKPLNEWGPSGANKQGGQRHFKRYYHQSPPTRQNKAQRPRRQPRINSFKTGQRPPINRRRNH